MILTLYKTLDASNVINKTLTDGLNFNVNLKADVDVLNPRLLMGRVDTVNYDDYNYCHIPELERYYFIRNVEILSNRLFALNCECDYLETHKTEILNSELEYRSKIGVGDYGDITPTTTGRELVSIHESDVVLELADNTLFSVMAWGV